MTYDELHDQAMYILDAGEDLERRELPRMAAAKYEQAAKLEEQAANLVPEDKGRARGILRRGAVSLWWRAGRPDRVVEVATRYLREPLLPGFARELQAILDEVQLPPTPGPIIRR